MPHSRSWLLAIALLVPAQPAHAGWSTHPDTIKVTSSIIPLVKACSDGGHGSYVVWQEEPTTGAGVLRVQHVLGSGDIDPAWPAEGAVACSASVGRSSLRVIADGLHGLYAWWRESTGTYYTRIDSTGHVAGGWPARGRTSTIPLAMATSDGAGGVYVAFSNQAASFGLHLSPGNTAAGGWPNAYRSLAYADSAAPYSGWPAIALAPDGGLYVAYASFGYDGTYHAGNWRVRRLTAAGTPALGWPKEGIALETFDRPWFIEMTESAPRAILGDGSGGIYVLIAIVSPTGIGLRELLFHVLADGTITRPGGLQVGDQLSYHGGGLDGSYTLYPRGPGEVYVGTPKEWYCWCGNTYDCEYRITSCTADSATALPPLDGALRGYDVATVQGGGLFFTYEFLGQSGIPCHYGTLWLVQTSPTSTWSERLILDERFWSGAAALVSTEPGGVVLFWSGVTPGLFARRFNSPGEVTGVAARLSTAPLAARFEPGFGVRARVLVQYDAKLELFDVLGRRRATLRLTRGDADVVIPGTRDLEAGVFFVVLQCAAVTRVAQVIVAR